MKKIKLKEIIPLILVFCLIIFLIIFINIPKNNSDNNDFKIFNNGKSEIEISLLDSDDYFKFIYNYNETNKTLHGNIFYKKSNVNYNEITDFMYVNNDLYFNFNKLFTYIKSNNDIKGFLEKYYTDDEVMSIINLMEKEAKDVNYLKLDLDVLGLSNLLVSFSDFDEKYYNNFIEKVDTEIKLNQKEIILKNQEINKFLDVLSNFLIQNKNGIFEILINNTLYIDETKFVEKPFVYKEIIENYSEEIIDTKSDLVILLENNQTFILDDYVNKFSTFIDNIRKNINESNISVYIERDNNFKITFRKENIDFIKITKKMNKKLSFNENLPSDAKDYFSFINNFKNEIYNILGFNENFNGNTDLIKSDWDTSLNLEEIKNSKIKEDILKFDLKAKSFNFKYPKLSETNGIYEYSLYKEANNEDDVVLISFEDYKNQSKLIECLFSQKYELQDFKNYSLNYSIKFAENFKELFGKEIDVEIINKVYQKLLEGQETYVSEMVYHNYGYEYISMNKINGELILRVINCQEN